MRAGRATLWSLFSLWSSAALNLALYLREGGHILNLITMIITGVLGTIVLIRWLARPLLVPPPHPNEIALRPLEPEQVAALFPQPVPPQPVPTDPVDAEKRAYELLFEHLDQAQLTEVALHGYFTVVGKSGTSYRINTETGFACDYCVHTIHYRKSGQRHPTWDRLPKGDRALTFKLWIEAAEAEFRAIAVYHPDFSPPEAAMRT